VYKQTLPTEGHWQWRFNYCKCCQNTFRNANIKWMSLRLYNSETHKRSIAKLQNIP